MKNKLSVIGLGKLGAPMLAVFAHKGFDVVGVDINKAFVQDINNGRAPVSEPMLSELISAHRERISATTNFEEAILNTDITFIIVPTPSKDNHFFSNDYLLDAIEQIGAALRKKDDYHLVVVTSTVMPGSTDGVIKERLEGSSGRKVGRDLGLCYNPEFIALGSVVQDMLNPDMILIGQSDTKAGDILESVYRQTIEDVPFCRMNLVNAEIAKISVNTYVTTKISYANMLADLCQRIDGANVDTVTQAIGHDSRIGHKYLRGATGYGGPCFPRDNKAFTALGKKLNARTDIADATDATNEYQVSRIKEIIRERVSFPATIAILGLSYKPNTHVIEESHSIKLAQALLYDGCKVILSDPKAMPPEYLLKESDVEHTTDHIEASKGADITIIMTPWEIYKDIHSVKADKLIDLWSIIPERAYLALQEAI